MIGRSDKLAMKRAVEHWKAQGLDFANILYRPEMGPEVGVFCAQEQDHGLENPWTGPPCCPCARAR